MAERVDTKRTVEQGEGLHQPILAWLKSGLTHEQERVRLVAQKLV